MLFKTVFGNVAGHVSLFGRSNFEQNYGIDKTWYENMKFRLLRVSSNMNLSLFVLQLDNFQFLD